MEATREYSSVQEKAVAFALGGKVVANSGATAFLKGDVSLPNALVECKTVMKKQTSISIKEEWLTKLREEACNMGKDYYALAVNFGPKEKNYYVIPEWMMQELLDKENR